MHPHRHDLDTPYCINNNIKVFNRKVRKNMKMYDYAKVMETNASTEHFTLHGLHMNRLGKELLSESISENLKSILKRKWPPRITLKWKEDSMAPSPVENTLDTKCDELEQKGTEAWTSGRYRKHPITRKDALCCQWVYQRE
jgi:hypothetical protein